MLVLPIGIATLTESGTSITRAVLFLCTCLPFLLGLYWLCRRVEIGFAEKCVLALYFFTYILPIAWEPTVHQILLLLPPKGGDSWTAEIAALAVVTLGWFLIVSAIFWAAKVKQRNRFAEASAGHAAAVSGVILLCLSIVGWWKLREIRELLEVYYQAGAQRFVFTSDLPAGYGRYSLMARLTDTALIFCGYWLSNKPWRGTVGFVFVLGCIGALLSSVSLGRMAIAASFLAPFAGYFLRRASSIRAETLIVGGLVLVPAFAVYSAFFRPLAGIENDTLLQKLVTYDIGRYHTMRNLLMVEQVGGLKNMFSDIFNWSDLFISRESAGIFAEPSHEVYSTYILGAVSSHIVPGGIGGAIVSIGSVGAVVAVAMISMLVGGLAVWSRSSSDSVRLLGVLGMWFIFRYVFLQTINLGLFVGFFVAPFLAIYLPSRWASGFFRHPKNEPTPQKRIS